MKLRAVGFICVCKFMALKQTYGMNLITVQEDGQNTTQPRLRMDVIISPPFKKKSVLLMCAE